MKKNYKYATSLGKRLKRPPRYLLVRTFIALMCLIHFSSAYSQNTRFTIKLQNVTLEKVFDQIKVQSSYTFFFEHEGVAKTKNVSIDVKNASIDEVMKQVLKTTIYTYQIVDKVIVIKLAKAEKKEKIEVQIAGEKGVEVSGRVTDRDGNPLAAATIVEKGTQNGVTANMDGTYSLKVTGENSILRISYIGFELQELFVGTKTTIDIFLQPAISSLEELTVIGYGTAKRESIGSAISQVNGKIIEEKSVGAVSFEQILGGQIKGVQITQSSGEPGAAAIFRVRGVTSPFSVGNNQPLFVIDGVPFNTDPLFDAGSYSGASQNPLLSISPNDIESLTVLKDAAATAIYGSRGANGVILIATKRGRKNSTIQTTLDYSLSLNNNINKLDLLDADGFKALHQMIAKNTLDSYALGNVSITGYRAAAQIIDPTTGVPRESLLDLITGKTYPVFGDANTDWLEEVYRKNAPTHQWNLGMSGGDAHTNFSLGISYTDQQPLVINTSFKRYGARLSIDSEVNSWLKIGSSVNYNGSRNFSTSTDNITMRPDYAVYDENGDFLRYPYVSQNVQPGITNIIIWGDNPVASLESENATYSTSFIGNAYAEARLFKGFKVRADVNTGVFKTRGRNFQPLRAQPLYSGSRSSLSISTLTNSVAENFNNSLNIQANYHRSIQKHDFEMMAGASWDRADYYRNSVSYSGLADDYVLTNAPSATTVTGSVEAKAGSGINSLYGRLQYSYGGKYTATVNFRKDKSSKFGPGNKVGYFPSLALNWNIDRETFMDKLKWVDKLILRASYGKTGSANVADFAYLQYFEAGASKNKEYESGNITIVPNYTYPNTDLHWESTREFNAGLDFSLFSNRLYASFDIYNKNTNGILIASPYPLESGAGSYTSNLAEISNKGWELEIGADIIRIKDFNWNVNFNIAANHNMVESMEGHALASYMTEYFTVGKPIGIIYGYRVEKIIQAQAEIDALDAASPTGVYHNIYTSPGDYLYKDLNGDGRITADDREVIGSTEPDYFGGINMMLSYKRLSLSAGFQYSVGNKSTWANYSLINAYSSYYNNALPEALADTWTPENTSATYPRLVYGYSYNGYQSDATLQDASYLRLKILRLNYKVPEKLLTKLALKSVTVYASATNLFTWSSFKGNDPEAGLNHPIFNYNADAYPYSRTFSFGIKVGF
ncbi:MAG: TonB-dependent receptor [Bacteroidales bacterium]|jgi:TonB-linked SusC/RagA family outer membrane protein